MCAPRLDAQRGRRGIDQHNLLCGVDDGEAFERVEGGDDQAYTVVGPAQLLRAAVRVA